MISNGELKSLRQKLQKRFYLRVEKQSAVKFGFRLYSLTSLKQLGPIDPKRQSLEI